MTRMTGMMTPGLGVRRQRPGKSTQGLQGRQDRIAQKAESPFARNPPGSVLKIDLKRRSGRYEYRVKLLEKGNRVKVADTGRTHLASQEAIMRLLVVEDEIALARDVANAVGRRALCLPLCMRREYAWFLGSTEQFSAVVLDLGLPKLDGLSVLKRWARKASPRP